MPPRSVHDALWNWTSSFDAEALIASFAQAGQQPEPGIIRNFLGTRIEPAVFPPVLTAMAGSVEPLPIPGNWHADVAEWGAALRTVDLAAASGRGRYRIIELGCGWGCWITNMGVAARARGLAVDLVGVEADGNHLANARRTLALNGFTAADFTLHHGVAGPRRGKAIFPAGQEGWGAEAIFDPDEQTLRRAAANRRVQVLDSLPLEVLASKEPVDLLHIDIQGAETDFVRGNSAAIVAFARRVLIGTHSRPIEGQLMDHFHALGWQLEVDRPVLGVIAGGRLETRIDGVQLWANTALS